MILRWDKVNESFQFLGVMAVEIRMVSIQA